MAENVTLQIDQTCKLEFTVAVTKDGAPLVMTGWTAKMQVRAKKTANTVLAEYTTENGCISFALGQVLLDVPGAMTAQLTVTSGVYDLVIYEPGTSEPRRVIEGNVLVSLATTR